MLVLFAQQTGKNIAVNHVYGVFVMICGIIALRTGVVKIIIFLCICADLVITTTLKRFVV